MQYVAHCMLYWASQEKTESSMSQIKEIQLRRASLADARAIASIRIECWRTTYRGVIPDAYLDGMSIEESAAQWSTILAMLPEKEQQICVFVAETDGQVIGFVSSTVLPIAKMGLQAELSGVYLLPAWQRCGIGKRMVQKVARNLLAQGVNSLLVWVLSENAIARNFFEELSAIKLSQQAYNWDALDLMEVSYGWNDLSVLVASVEAFSHSNALH